MVPVVFLDEPGGSFWAEFLRFIERKLLKHGMVNRQDLCLYKLTDNVEEAVDEIGGFFHAYHSMRYVRSKLVLRLNGPLGDELLDGINTRFADILLGGQFTIGGPLPEEKDEPDLAHLPRLIFQFNRRDFGRLRQLIDCINRR